MKSRLHAADPNAFEQKAVARHEVFGRVLSWIVFSVGCEYVLKGVCLVRGLICGRPKDVLRAPSDSDDLEKWIKGVLASDTLVYEKVVSCGTLGQLPIDKLVEGLPQADLSKAAFELLRESIRNRDAHQYVCNVRSAHFHAVPKLFIPALNAALGSLDASQLRVQTS